MTGFWYLFLVFLAGIAAKEIPYSSVSCPGLGSFSNDPPFNDLPLPWCPDRVKPQFHLYTRLNWNERQLITREKIPSVFRGSRKTILATHGFRASSQSSWLTDLKNEFLKKGDYNVIIFDWAGGANLIATRYTNAASNTRVAGAEIALILDKLADERGLKFTNVYLIGHSLGSHVCGFAGGRTYHKVDRITGLDPAGPWFINKPRSGRLDKSDASYVDIIHTHAGLGLPSLGHAHALGHADFYPNGGENQPGCFAVNDEDSDEYGGIGCSHGRAYEFFVESINSRCKFTSPPCESKDDLAKGKCASCRPPHCQFMGYQSPTSPARGTFYLETRAAKPFCIK